MIHVSDKSNITKKLYKTAKPLKSRQSIYNYTIPHIDLDGEIISHLNFSNVKNILDIGCGYGRLLMKIRVAYQGDLYGVELSEGILAKAIESNKKNSFNIKYTKTDAENLLFEDDFFDIIICEHVLHHVGNVKKAVDEVYRCLKTGGKYIVTLNSQDRFLNMKNFNKKIADKLNMQVHYSSDYLNIKNFSKYIQAFKGYEYIEYENQVVLNEIDPILEYFNSIRGFFELYPNDKTWEEAKNIFEKMAKNEFKQKGKFIEKSKFGMFICTK